MPRWPHLITQIARFESFVDDDAPLSEVLPELYNAHKERYKGYTIRELCQEMHDFYKSVNVKDLQKAMFRKEYFPRRVLNAQEANYEFIRDNVELVRLSEAEGRVGVEGALPYPPGVLCLVPGGVGAAPCCSTSSPLRRASTSSRALHPELQGVYIEEDEDGRRGRLGQRAHARARDRTPRQSPLTSIPSGNGPEAGMVPGARFVSGPAG